MIEIKSIYFLKDYLNKNERLENLVFKNLDLRKIEETMMQKRILECLFIGCTIGKNLLEKLSISDNYILPSIKLPFEMFPRKLYTIHDLYDYFDPSIPNSYKNSTDYEIYSHFVDHQRKQTLSTFLQVTENIHDASMEIALSEYIKEFDEKKIIGVMGGHKVARNNPEYLKVARVSKQLSENGYIMVSGGGPGMMEATHLGAWFSGRNDSELIEAISILSEAPYFTDEKWLVQSYHVMEKYTPLKKQISLSVPTWVHGHEPPNPFAGKIAKFFSAATRQEVLIQITKGGIIFSRGSAGTLREIFQTVEQNHYNLWDNNYPMLFLDKEYWNETIPVYDFLKQTYDSESLKNLVLSIHDDGDDIVNRILELNNI